MFLDTPEIRAWHERTAAAFRDPRPGDSFDEMLSFRVFVLAAEPDGGPVTVVEANPPCTLPRDGKLRRFRCVHEFRDAYAYRSGAHGYWVGLNQRGVNVDGWLAYLELAEQDTKVKVRRAQGD